MNRQLVENILSVLKTSSDKGVIHKGLLKLRTDLVKDQEGIVLFREAGGVAPIIRFLNKPHEQILEVALSILGNCCTDILCCKEALECKISLPLTIILKSIPNPVIQCRACRLLGNLAKSYRDPLLATHCPAIAQSVCHIIEDASDVQTRVMAFRACRFLLSNAVFLKHFLNADGLAILLRILAAVMKNDTPKQEEELLRDNPAALTGLKNNQHREKYFEEVARNLEGVRSDIFDHEVLKNTPKSSNVYAMPKEKAALDLACEILKCLLVMSELQISWTVWKALQKHGSTFAPIVFFMTEENNHRSVALKILSNFSKNLGAFYILSSADAIVAACELLMTESMGKPLSENETRHCINIICMLSPDACNRSKIRRSGALRKLIAMVRESKSQTEISSILYLLNNFQYDNISMDLMLREGLIPVLIKELNIYLTSDDEYHKRKREEKQQNTKKRKLNDKSEESKCKVVKVRDDTFLLDCDSPGSSPRSSVSPSSPCSSRCMSPIGSNLFKLDDDAADDETYSPVCSDDEDEGDEDNNVEASQENNANVDSANSGTSEIMKLLDIACRSAEAMEDNLSDKEDVEDTSQDAPLPKLPQLGNMPRSTIDIIENLLFRVTLLINKRGELGKPETINTLIKAINVFGPINNFAGSLTNILLESQFFAQVIRSGVAHQLYQLTKTTDMRKDGFSFLETLTCVGESNYGKAELARFLRCDDVIGQKRAAITVAYIIKSQRLLYQFLNDGNALTVLFNIILSGKRDEYTAEAVDALTSMSKYTLGISVPLLEGENERTNGDYEEFNEEKSLQTMLETDCDMRFVVHERNADADKESVVVAFSKQLLCDTSEVFNTMLNSDFREKNEGEIHLRTYTVSGLKYFLNLIVRQSQHLKYNIPSRSKYHALLEAFEMSRIYIMVEMEKFLQEMLIGLLDETNCLSLLEWSMKNYHTELTEMAINYYLCSMLTTDAKVKLFHSADYSEYSTEWFHMIYEAVLYRCRNGF